MGLAAGILSIVVGIAYLIYKYGEEEMDLGKSGGILLVVGIGVGLFVFGIIFNASEVFGGIIAWGAFLYFLVYQFYLKDRWFWKRVNDRSHRLQARRDQIAQIFPYLTDEQFEYFKRFLSYDRRETYTKEDWHQSHVWTVVLYGEANTDDPDSQEGMNAAIGFMLEMIEAVRDVAALEPTVAERAKTFCQNAGNECYPPDPNWIENAKSAYRAQKACDLFRKKEGKTLKQDYHACYFM